jgi:glucose/arabinose dehydrogenase
MPSRLAKQLSVAALLIGVGCGSSEDPTSPVDPNVVGAQQEGDLVAACDTAGLTLPPGFCATVYADNLGRARHIAVTPSGDAFVSIAPPRGSTMPGHVVALRDADHDGVAEVQETIAPIGGNGIAWAHDHLFLALDDRIVRYGLADGALQPEGALPIVTGLPASGDHTAKTVVVVGDRMFVNFGSASNSCQVENRVLHSPGVDPCPELCERAGIWEFSAMATGQTAETGTHFATGMRNTNALAYDARNQQLWGAINGRDQLHENWPELFDEQQDLLRPSEEVVTVNLGDDYGWPYCYHDKFLDQKVLAPEYGGDGVIEGRCAGMKMPDAVLPGHWAPLGMAFSEGTQFPAHYQNGAFITTHGSRFDMNAQFDPGYNVVFIPFDGGQVAGDFEHFAVGFAGPGLPLPAAAVYRPVGIAMLPDGSMLVGDDKVGRIWRITYPH